jgi:hypothetical protein
MPEQTSTTTTTTTKTTIAIARDGRVTLNADAEEAATLAAESTEGAGDAMQPLVVITTETTTNATGGGGSGDPGTHTKTGPMGGSVPGE